MYGRMVYVGKRLKAVGDETSHIAVLLIGKPVEHVVVIVDSPIQLADSLRVAEGRIEAAIKRCKRTLVGDRGELVLLQALGIQKEEELVPDDWPTQVAAEIVALESAHVRGNILVAKQIEAFTMPLVASRPGDHIDRARGSQLRGQV